MKRKYLYIFILLAINSTITLVGKKDFLPRPLILVFLAISLSLLVYVAFFKKFPEE
ncbi:hypothetical protein RU97_GL000702 [Enterococcus canis]|uniref:Uncharacterized protein n=1 Tax=Enterococcus canis TaxID=214095 RepID=A0A1L8RH55_9ENTE|nr:hypothetical protein RU97_GL000702 [Enterococcus canis]